MLTVRCDGFFTVALAELPRFVAADVYLAAAETGQVVVEQAGHEGQRRVVRLQCAGKFFELSGQRVDPALGAFGERSVAWVAQPALHVPEGIEVRDEFDAERRASRVEFADLHRRQGRGVLPSILVTRERKGMFDVELELVDA